MDWIVAAPSTYKGWLLEVCPRSAGGVEAIRDKAARRDEAVLKAAGGVEAVRVKAAGEIFRIEAAARHSIVFRPSSY